ncbi:MAG: ABC transporter permease [Candidatus Bathyarchaeia archaeon]
MNLKDLYKKSPKLLIGTVIFSFFVLLATLGSVLYDVDPSKPQFESLEPPSLEHPLGTDILGRDLLAQLIQGTGYSLKIGIMAALITTVIGVAVGGIGGYFGGMVDEILNLASNVILTIPTIAFLVVIAAYFRVRSEWIIILLISSTSWGAMARSIRSQVLSLRTRDFVDLAKLSGMGRLRILFSEVLPNMMSYLVMYLALSVASAIGSEAGLSAIGLGPTAIVSLGMLLRWVIVWEAVRYGAWWWFLPVGASITLVTLSLLLINDGLDQLYNPRARRG